MSEGNPSYGIRQITESTWAMYGGKTGDPAEQARVGLEYAKARYGKGKSGATIEPPEATD